MNFKKKSCLTCKNWNLDTCELTKEFTSFEELCKDYVNDREFIWALLYDTSSNELSSSSIHDIYKTKKSAESEIDYLTKRGYNNIRIINLKEPDDE